MAKLAFLGLGVMGFPMAGHLRAAGHEVRVWNRTEQRGKDWETTYGDGAVSNPAEAVQSADFVMICVGADADVYAVIETIKGRLKPGRHVRS